MPRAAKKPKPPTKNPAAAAASAPEPAVAPLRKPRRITTGEYLAHLAKLRGLSIKEVSRRTGYDDRDVRRWFKDETTPSNVQAVLALAFVLSPDESVEGRVLMELCSLVLQDTGRGPVAFLVVAGLNDP